MKRDGLVADNEVLSCFMAAFAHDGGEDPGSIEDDFNKGLTLFNAIVNSKSIETSKRRIRNFERKRESMY